MSECDDAAVQRQWYILPDEAGTSMKHRSQFALKNDDTNNRHKQMNLSWRCPIVRALQDITYEIFCVMVRLLQRDAIAGTGVTAHTIAGNSISTLQDGERPHERGTTTQNGSTRTRPKTKHPPYTGAAETKQHTAPSSPNCKRIKSIRLHPDT